MAKFREIGEINPKNEVKSRRRRDFLQNYYKTKVLISTVQGLVNPTTAISPQLLLGPARLAPGR
jgi:hypothetical protein